ncbi:hypothetical protein SVAN01_10323 [Stagonosporopsis vannaccii]|nr:hypothetical protein SVAN01_10323 [Stagonosporopsis vannaccii]
MPLSASLRSLLSASASASLAAETSLCESSAASVTTDVVSSSSSRRRRRAMLVGLLRAGAMSGCGWGRGGGSRPARRGRGRQAVPAAEGARQDQARRQGERAGRVARLRGAAGVMEQEGAGERLGKKMTKCLPRTPRSRAWLAGRPPTREPRRPCAPPTHRLALPLLCAAPAQQCTPASSQPHPASLTRARRACTPASNTRVTWRPCVTWW